MRPLAALVLAFSVAYAAHAHAAGRARLAVVEFQMDAGAPPALGMQLQDGFVLGLVRAGVQVIDGADTAKKLEAHPELQHCDSSPCLKEIGQELDVNYITRVKVDVAGNSYKVVGRLFSTEGAAPAVLPVATESRSCDVCTVAEARTVMLRVADALRAHIEEPPAQLLAPAAPVPPSPPRIVTPLVLAMAGAVAIGVGFGVLASNGHCTATACDENRTRSAVGGVLIGAGVVLAAGGTYVTIVRSRGGDPVTAIAVAFRF